MHIHFQDAALQNMKATSEPENKDRKHEIYQTFTREEHAGIPFAGTHHETDFHCCLALKIYGFFFE
jgi:hypothetical protein